MSDDPLNTGAGSQGEPDTEHWLDGLAGRPGSGPAHDDGKLLRRALREPQHRIEPNLSWAEIERCAVQGPAAPVAEPLPAPVQVEPRTLAPAANDRRWRPSYALAAVLVLGVALGWVLQQRQAEETLRGDAGAGAVWVVPEPQAAADQLSAELLALGAQVKVTQDGSDRLLTISASGEALSAVNARLSTLETALGTDGRLALRIRAR